MEVLSRENKKKNLTTNSRKHNNAFRQTKETVQFVKERQEIHHLANHFEPELTNFWDFPRCDPRFGFDYPGRMPGQIVQNLLYYYTKDGDIVVDPFAGSGTTIDVCKSMNRKCYAFDLKPSKKGIKQNNILDGIPVEKCNLIILDPPYWLQKKGEYTDESSDLSNMSFNQFVESMKKVFEICYDKLLEGGHVAFISSPAKLNGKIYDIPFECYKMLLDKGYKLRERIIAPYRGASSMTGYWLAYARRSKTMLRAYRDLLVFRKED